VKEGPEKSRDSTRGTHRMTLHALVQ
jgi:hypothetical protein